MNADKKRIKEDKKEIFNKKKDYKRDCHGG